MRITKYNYSSFKMHKPATGEVIIDGEWFDDPKPLIAIWADIVFEEPDIYNESFKADWETFVAKYEEENGCQPMFDDLERFLEEYESPDWSVFEISDEGLSCGPVSGTTWFVVDKDVIVDELDDDNLEVEENMDNDSPG